MDVVDVDPMGATSFVDAESSALLVRDGIMQYAADNPAWKVFAASPPLDYSSTDTRQLWCWNIAAPPAGCQKALANASSPAGWDIDAALGTPWFLTRGNNARATEKWNSNTSAAQGVNYSASATRDYVYPWTNQWYTSRCNPASFTSPQRNDIDAANANLHAMHNRMHDWSYALGFTETTYNAQAFNFGRGGAQNDPEHGNAQAGGIVGGPPGYASRDNANQFSPTDGDRAGDQHVPLAADPVDVLLAVRRRRLRHVRDRARVRPPGLQPHGRRAERRPLRQPGRRDGRELVRPPGGRVPQLARASSRSATRTRSPSGRTSPGDKAAGIRNYAMNDSPLNYSDVGYDFACNQAGTCTQRTQVHADGEIWSATNYDVRRRSSRRTTGRTRSSNLALQRSCADGLTPVAPARATGAGCNSCSTRGC